MPNKGAERGGDALGSRQRLSQKTLASMLVAVRAMHMAVGNFFSGGCPHGGDLAAELQRLARQGVVAVQMHFGALDLDHVEHGRLSVVAHALQLAAHLHAGRELALGNGAHQAFVTRFADLKGDILLAQGKREEARAAYKAVVTALETTTKSESAALREIAQAKLDAVGGAQ